MSATPESILKRYWGYDSFRPLQREIVQQPLEGKDVLALLPTGGGKSICFQVPALCMKGICVVVSPLIALMKDQVSVLKALRINAMALHSGMRFSEVDGALDTCVYGDVKFLYLSPERLRNEMVRVRLQKMNVCLIAVDEAHCISQWGYDFRPSYLQIADLRELLPNVPLIGLTATATPQVVTDIQEKLLFKHANVLQKSFYRKNLSYLVLHEVDAKGRLLRILSRTDGSAIVYVRNRRQAKTMAQFLTTQQIGATYYHAGLSINDREDRQSDWIGGRTRVIVATNAFGMGIDKANVSAVIHIGFPDSLESYFQEAGRAGRDGHESYAVALVSATNVKNLNARLNRHYPDRSTIRNVYYSLGSLFQLAEGSGEDEWFDLDLGHVTVALDMKVNDLLMAISFLEKAGHLILNIRPDHRSTLQVMADSETVYELELRNPKIKRLTRALLRSYGRLFDEQVVINEKLLAKRSGYSLEQVGLILAKLQKLGIIDYRPATGMPKLNFVGGRVRKQDLHITREIYEDRIHCEKLRTAAAIHYVTSDKVCRSQLLLKYFGETETTHCGKCDVCRKLSEQNVANDLFPIIKDFIKEPISIEELLRHFESSEEKSVLKAVQTMLDNNEIVYQMDGSVSLP